jgi:MoxR-like ATPase
MTNHSNKQEIAGLQNTHALELQERVDVSSLPLNEKFQVFERRLNGEIFEREHEVHSAMLALVGAQHHFSVGPPGLAKSLLVDRISRRIEGMEYFHWLLTKFTSPEEIFGGTDLLYMKETGLVRRVTDGKLPTAHVAFLDEIFKGSSPILNTLLTAMNERKFFNPGEDPRIPLITIFGASNEVPETQELGAMWDRLHFRHVTAPLGSAAAFGRMMRSSLDPEPEAILSLADLYEAQRASQSIHVSDDVLDAIIELRSTLRAHDVVVTDRRWKETMKIIRSEAWLQGNKEVTIDDCRPLVHVLWSDEAQRREVLTHVLSMINPLDRKAQELWEALRDMENDLDTIMKESDNDRIKLQKCMEAFNKIVKMKEDYKEIVKSGRKTEYTLQAAKKFEDLVGYVRGRIQTLREAQ